MYLISVVYVVFLGVVTWLQNFPVKIEMFKERMKYIF